MKTLRLLTGVLVLLAVSVPSAKAQQTTAERTGYTETSSHADVISFLDSLGARAEGKFVRGSIGNSVQGKILPFILASRPLVHTPAEARATGKPIVYVQGNIHGGEVEGKEAMQAMLRDLLTDPGTNILDSLILIVVPIYNADGNDSWGPQERQRGAQNGPERIGLRPNADQLDLNRDYIKAESPETRGSLAMFAQWDPDVFMDLHTTNGSYHGYGITYAPSLHPAAMDGALAPAGPWTRDTLLPEVRARMRAKHGVEVYDYGNFSGPDNTRDDPTKLEKGGWLTYEHKPRFGTNYYGLKNGVSVLSEAYSHDPMEKRVRITRQFVTEVLSFVAENAAAVTARTRTTSAAASMAPTRPQVPIRAVMTKSPFMGPILVEALENAGDSVRYEAGLRPGLKRTHRAVPVTMPIYDRFDAAMMQTLPEAWVLDSAQSEVVERLLAHGISVTQLSGNWRGSVETFVVDSLIKSPRPFQGHQELRIEGRWSSAPTDIPAGSWVIGGRQKDALLAAILLEPQSDDGLTTWNAFDTWLEVGGRHPVRRIVERIELPQR